MVNRWQVASGLALALGLVVACSSKSNGSTSTNTDDAGTDENAVDSAMTTATSTATCGLKGDTCGAEACCSGVCNSGTCVCTDPGGNCQNATQCCSGVCASGICASCNDTGSLCESNANCCTGICTNGICGGSSAFVGTWQWATGLTTTVTCAGMTQTEMNVGNVVISNGSTSGTIILEATGDDASACAITFAVAGNNATFVNDMCSSSSATVTFPSFSLMLGADDQSIAVLAVEDETADGMTCTARLSGTLVPAN